MVVIYYDENNNIVKINVNKLDEFNFGKEGTVYKYNDYALKVYSKLALKDRLNEKQCKALTNITTKRILLPMKPVYNISGKKMKGYMINPYIDNAKKFDEITKIKTDVLIDELNYIYDDVDILTKERVAIYDLHTNSNIMYNGKIYFIDPGSFEYDYKDGLKRHNLDHINESLFKHLILLQNNYKYLDKNNKYIFENYFGGYNHKIYLLANELIKEIYENYYTYYIANSGYEKFGDYMYDVLNKYGDLNGYKAQIIKEAIDNDSSLIKEEQKQLVKSIYK